MYISIDMDNLVFLHKHADHEVVSAISWMECGVHRSIVVSPTDKARFLKTLSLLELKMLYKNTTGGTLVRDDPVTLRYQLVDAVHLLGCTRALRDEVFAQLDQVDSRVHNGETFKYAYGARVPAQPQELFPLKGRTLSASELENAATWARSNFAAETANAPCGPYPERKTELMQEASSDNEAIAAVSEPARQLKKPKRMNAKAEIYHLADIAWRAAGQPTDPAVLKALWSGLLPDLTENKGLHPTTCRIKLAEWARERASNSSH